ncbi:MAG: S8 family serine peptidase [Planctomycetota bacterium]|jgi:subtilisin family serine protease
MRALLLLTVCAVAAAQEAAEEVVVLGRTQLLAGGKAFDEFCRAHAARKRSALRAEIVAKLKAIAAEEQPAILQALGSPAGARSLWIVNAVVVRLTPAQVQRARGLAPVKYVYPAGVVPAKGDAGTVEHVLKPTERAPFSTKRKQISWNVKRLHVPEVWRKLSITGEGVVVAMLDQGVNYLHEDLRGNMWINAGEVANNGKDDDGNGYVDDLYGFNFARLRAEVRARGPRQHGSWTSSVVAGDGTGGQITGVAPRARIMALIGFGGAYNAARAFEYALANGADIVNMSFSIPGLGQTRGLWRLMAEHATCAGLVLVSGAGNFQQQAKVPVQIRIPEGIPCVICAGGVTERLKVPRFVSLGPVEWGSVAFYEDYPMPKGLTKPDVCAFPGPKIGLISAKDEGYLPDSNQRRGNSLSAPHVAGVCALILSANRELTPWRVKEILEQTAKDLPPRGKDNRSGAGLVHAYRAVRAARGE